MKKIAQLFVNQKATDAGESYVYRILRSEYLAACSLAVALRWQRWCALWLNLSLIVFALCLAMGVVNRVGADELDTRAVAPSNSTLAQELRAQLIWQASDAVRARLGEPMSERAPIGTHASYSLWVYEQVVVAFANGRVIHVFDRHELSDPSS